MRIKQKISVPLQLLLVQTGVWSFSFLFLAMLLREQGLFGWFFILGYMALAALCVISLLLVTKYNAKWFLRMSYVLNCGMALGFFVLPLREAFLVYVFGWAGLVILFWLPLNMSFFQESHNGRHAKDSWSYMVAPGMLSIVIPPLGAMMMRMYGYKWLFLLTAGLYLLAMGWVWRKVPSQTWKVQRKEAILNFKGLKTISMMEGALHFFSSVVLGVYALRFLQNETEVGWFWSYVAVVGLVAGFFMARMSDAKQERKKYVVILFSLLLICVVGFMLAKSLGVFLVLMGAYMIMATVSSPIRLAISMDVKEKDINFWWSRELFLNIGRAVTLAVAGGLFFLEWYGLLFGMYAVMIGAYPILIFHKLKKLR
jgi:MFS family permease